MMTTETATATPAATTQTDVAAPDETVSRLGVAIGNDNWLIDLSEAGEILPMPESITPIPGARAWFLGLTNLRGVLFGVTDLAGFLGRASPGLGKDARLLAFSDKLHVNASIVVNRMLGLQTVSAMRPDPGVPEQGWMGRGYVDASGVRWRELHLSRLCRDRQYLSIART